MSRRDLGLLAQVPVGEGRCFRVGGRELAVFRTREGGPYAIDAKCPHRAGPLADGVVGGGSITCPLHARRFDLATGAPIGHEGPPVCTFPLEVRDGVMSVELDLEEPR
jgi:nitrite reductase (NADH) small subunit